jgi:hypothetical protein
MSAIRWDGIAENLCQPRANWAGGSNRELSGASLVLVIEYFAT